MPNPKPNFMLRKLQGKEKKIFDSADHEMTKQTNKSAVSRGAGLNPNNKPEIPPEVREGLFLIIPTFGQKCSLLNYFHFKLATQNNE